MRIGWAALAALAFVGEGTREEKLSVVANLVLPNGTKVPRTVAFTMVHVPGGKFMMGSPKGEADRGDDESEPREVEVKPFWMGKCEVTWGEYECFYQNEESDADAETWPSLPFEPPDRKMGREDHAAMSIQRHAARNYCKWLSKKLGKKFRLPTEAEWEYAARAGAKEGAPGALADHAWFKENTADNDTKKPKNQRVGQKKPNAFGLHDMLGGVWEYVDEDYAADDATPQVRGGSWEDPVAELRYANRQKILPAWNARDPNRPRGVSWLTDGQFVGFRLVRDPEPGEK